MMRVLLLKEPRNGDVETDPYGLALGEFGVRVRMIPPLTFKFKQLAALRKAMVTTGEFSGLVLTSPRAVEAVSRALSGELLSGELVSGELVSGELVSGELVSGEALSGELRDKWASKIVYVVGEATGDAVRSKLGLEARGDQSGNAHSLAHIIINGHGGEGTGELDTAPLLFPCGSLKSEVLPTLLQQNGVPLRSITVYETIRNPELSQRLRAYIGEEGAPHCVVFFSPSGVRFCLDEIRSLTAPSFSDVKLGAIGSSTASLLSSLGFSPDFVSPSPGPAALASVIAPIQQWHQQQQHQHQ